VFYREAPNVTTLLRALNLACKYYTILEAANVDKPLKSLIAQNSFTNTVWPNDQKTSNPIKIVIKLQMTMLRSLETCTTKL
jgi:hypothetical protein